MNHFVNIILSPCTQVHSRIVLLKLLVCGLKNLFHKNLDSTKTSLTSFRLYMPNVVVKQKLILLLPLFHISTTGTHLCAYFKPWSVRCSADKNDRKQCVRIHQSISSVAEPAQVELVIYSMVRSDPPFGLQLGQSATLTTMSETRLQLFETVAVIARSQQLIAQIGRWAT